MEFSKLGKTGLDVSRVCLGTMTWGEQNTEAEGHEQMDYAVDRGVNFFDTAEMYAVPPKAETYGRTEEIIGTWFKKTGNRDKVILASKVAGRGWDWIRDGEALTGDSVRKGIEGSLKRLQTDYIDVYQLHWPNRPFPHLGTPNLGGYIDFTSNDTARIEDNFLDILTAVNEIHKEGKIRHFGISDDTAWGIMKYNELAAKHNMPRVNSIQNEFSLLDRTDDPYLAEVCVRENVAYLPWSPLGGGILSGKYLDGKMPKGSRWEIDDRESFRDNEPTANAIKGYIEVAKKHGLDVCQMALKFVDKQNFVTSTIIGATSMEQLKTDIDAFDVELSNDVMADIDAVYRQYPIPY